MARTYQDHERIIAGLLDLWFILLYFRFSDTETNSMLSREDKLAGRPIDGT
jgi:hypothetical protein